MVARFQDSEGPLDILVMSLIYVFRPIFVGIAKLKFSKIYNRMRSM